MLWPIKFLFRIRHYLWNTLINFKLYISVYNDNKNGENTPSSLQHTVQYVSNKQGIGDFFHDFR
jgi:hypothetical protein